MNEPWKPVSRWQLAAGMLPLAIITKMRLSNPEGWVRIVDDANLLFHEAGHPIFGILGETVGLYGGTIGQLTFPVVMIVLFWRKREPLSFSLSLAWFFENLLNISRYMADARAQILPLVGGCEHDWTQIFLSWNVLHYDLQIAGAVRLVGWLGFFGSGVWLILKNLTGPGQIPQTPSYRP